MLDQDQLEELERLADAATPGPWRDRAEKHHNPDGLIYGPDDEYDGDYRIVGSLKGRKGFGSVHWSQYTIPTAKQGYSNAAFIATANPKTIKDLIAQLKSERSARHKLSDALREKDAAMSVLFQRLADNNIDVSDLLP